MATCDTVRLVVAGHVDHGKSTLIGRLLHETGRLPEGKLEQLAAAARRRGVAFEWANLTDALQAERDQNVTIETAQIWFRDRDREYVIIDAPGHHEFLKNMITGAAQADAALIVLDVLEGAREQSRRHAQLIELLGLRQVVVLVNKMDLVDYAEEAYERVARDYGAFLATLGCTALATLPISARAGDHLTRPSEAMPWFTGEPLLGVMRRFTPTPAPSDRPLRWPVQDVYKFDRRRVAVGRLEAGRMRVGDRIIFLPGGQQSRVATLERWPGNPSAPATAGDSIGVTLTDPLFLQRGVVGAAAEAPPTLASTFRARLFWIGRSPLAAGRVCRLKLTTQDAECEIERIERVIDADALAETEPTSLAADPVTRINRNDLAVVRIRCRQPIALDRFEDIGPLGRFVLLDDGVIAGGGIVIDAIETAASANGALVSALGPVRREDRERRHRHRGAVVWFTGLSGSGKSTLATALERALFDRGVQVFVLDGDNIRLGLNKDLGFSEADRAENIRRVGEVAKLFADAGLVTITAFISPYRSDRARVRQIMGEGSVAIPFLEVFLDVPLDVCAARDPKGLYARARDGRIRQFTGVSDPYEPPDTPDLTLRTAEQSIDAAVAELLAAVLPQIARDRLIE
jgi:bifunctional enzyme CysN/CysC